MPIKPLPSSPSLEHLQYQAKDLLAAANAGNAEALSRIRAFHPKFSSQVEEVAFSLADAQLVIAHEYGFESWPKLKRHVLSMSERPTLERYERIAEDLLKAYRTGDSAAMQTVWTHFGHRRSWDVMRRYVLLDLGKGLNSEKPDTDISVAEAQLLVARSHGFESWQTLAEYLAKLPRGVTIAAKPVKLFAFDAQGGKKTVGRAREWERVFDMLQQRRAPGIDAKGQMTDALLERISALGHITSLDLHGSSQLTDAGASFLTRMPHLEHLDLSGTAITDHGLEVLRRLKKLRSLNLSWTRITDVGATHLSDCDSLERIDLSATRTGDGAIKALAGKRNVRFIMSGGDVTNDGIALFHEFPVFKTWQGGEASMALLDYEAGPNYLGLRGSFDKQGVAKLAGLDGLFALNLDDSKLALAGSDLVPIMNLPHLGWLAFDAKDDAMPYIAAMPQLRFLMCQDTVAGDDGFASLSRSQSLEYIWGRRCYNLRAPGFTALAAMPSLRGLSVSCRSVDDEGLSALPRFPALKELMPMDVPDEGYRHVGRCENLESLVLMYCRDTSDRATEHIASLPGLKKYFASYTKITDRSMEILSRIRSLEEICFYGCPAVTNAGVMALARLPRLRKVDVSGPKITAGCAAAFPRHVKTQFSDAD